MFIRTIDFEASCLPRHGRSFPIEVGIAGAGWTQSWLIRPHENWAGWDWTREAEALHGLSLERVMREGMPAATVFHQLVAMLDGCRIVADSMIDQYWLETLAEAAGAESPFLIDHVSMLLDENGADEPAISAAVAYADGLHPDRHRAGSDASWLAALLDHVAGRVPPVHAMTMHPPLQIGASNNL